MKLLVLSPSITNRECKKIQLAYLENRLETLFMIIELPT